MPVMPSPHLRTRVSSSFDIILLRKNTKEKLLFDLCKRDKQTKKKKSVTNVWNQWPVANRLRFRFHDLVHQYFRFRFRFAVVVAVWGTDWQVELAVLDWDSCLNALSSMRCLVRYCYCCYLNRYLNSLLSLLQLTEMNCLSQYYYCCYWLALVVVVVVVVRVSSPLIMTKNSKTIIMIIIIVFQTNTNRLFLLDILSMNYQLNKMIQITKI